MEREIIEKAKHKKQNNISVRDVEFKVRHIDHIDEFAKAMHKQIEKNKKKMEALDRVTCWMWVGRRKSAKVNKKKMGCPNNFAV